MNLKDKSIIITGASSGIGKELAFQMSKKGAKVVLAARNAAALKEIAEKILSAGGTAIAVRTDVTKRGDVDALVKKALAAYGRLDVFVANAGMSLSRGTIMQNSEEDVRSIMDTNFMGSVYGVWAAVPALERSGGGLLVFVSSIVGKRGVALSAPYCASKFAIQGLTEAIRAELRPKNIRVVDICPPGVDTPFFDNSGRKPGARRFRVHPVSTISAMIVRACEKETREALLTMDAKLIHWGNVLFPRLMDWAVAKNKGV